MKDMIQYIKEANANVATACGHESYEINQARLGAGLVTAEVMFDVLKEIVAFREESKAILEEIKGLRGDAKAKVDVKEPAPKAPAKATK